ncbi:unnamed protein product [Mucor circinelloides]
MEDPDEITLTDQSRHQPSISSLIAFVDDYDKKMTGRMNWSLFLLIAPCTQRVKVQGEDAGAILTGLQEGMALIFTNGLTNIVSDAGQYRCVVHWSLVINETHMCEPQVRG